jgi:hypothetical protein
VMRFEEASSATTPRCASFGGDLCPELRVPLRPRRQVVSGRKPVTFLRVAPAVRQHKLWSRSTGYRAQAVKSLNVSNVAFPHEHLRHSFRLRIGAGAIPMGQRKILGGHLLPLPPACAPLHRGLRSAPHRKRMPASALGGVQSRAEGFPFRLVPPPVAIH